MPISIACRGHWAARAIVTTMVLLLTACGGGGGGGGRGAPVAASLLGASSALADVCTLDGEKRFARSYVDEVYLWRDRVPAVDASAFSSLTAYFDALMVRTPDANGLATDRFSAVISTASANSMLSATVTPVATVLTPATASVPLVSAVSSPGARQVGYILFDRHTRGAQDALITAFEALKSHAVADLVLDLRNNPGGYLYVAQTLASMVTGPQHTGEVFETLRYSPQRTAAGAGQTLRFHHSVTTAEALYPQEHPLPQLNLPRVYVLASGLTCSASESVVNSLRGIGVQVVLVGGTTCGKPYGFHRKDNCGKAYFAIEFQGFNARGEGDYSDGFAPQCAVDEDPGAALGSPGEPLLAAALHHIDTGSCPAATRAAELRSRRAPDAQSLLLGRLLH